VAVPYQHIETLRAYQCQYQTHISAAPKNV